jgi:hypothetical protein
MWFARSHHSERGLSVFSLLFSDLEYMVTLDASSVLVHRDRLRRLSHWLQSINRLMNGPGGGASFVMTWHCIRWRRYIVYMVFCVALTPIISECQWGGAPGVLMIDLQ